MANHPGLLLKTESNSDVTDDVLDYVKDMFKLKDEKEMITEFESEFNCGKMRVC